MDRFLSYNYPDTEYGLVEIHDYLLMGFIRNNDKSRIMLIGPIRIGVATNDDIKRIIQEFNLPRIYETYISTFLNSIPLISTEKITSIIALIYLMVKNKQMNVESLIGSLDQEEIEAKQKSAKKEKMFSINRAHNDGKYEQRLIYIIRNGMVEELKNLTFEPEMRKMGKLGPNELRSLKNGLIILNSICLRAAVSGGLDVETSYALGEYYAQRIESCYSLTELSSVSRNIKKDYCTRVRDINLPKIDNLHVFKATKYIDENLYNKITVQEVADEIGIEPEYLAFLFKKEVNTTVSKYILSRKIMESKKLLRFTDISIEEIASKLCFSSQSHFQNVFKKVRGITPNKYRKLYQGSNYDKT
ncbi:MAG: helix-turn-helix domain-containing protein [Bacilli bacterium]|nr:helix-turn-helix domain-containing protein [Bacilli bacterium]